MIANQVEWTPELQRMTELEQRFYLSVLADGLPTPEFDVALIKGRKYRSDFVWRPFLLIVEVEGGTWGRKGATRCPVCGQTPQGRHTTPAGFKEDCTKYNKLALLGYRVFRFTTDMISSGEALETLKMALGSS